MGVICHFNNTMKGEKKMHCIFSKRNKCVFIFHEGHWRECHTNITVLLLIRTFPRLKFLSKCVVQYCVWVHVGWKCSRMLAIYLLVISVFYLLPFDCHTLFFQHLSEGQCLTYFWILLPFLFPFFLFLNMALILDIWNREGVSKSIRWLFFLQQIWALLLWSNLLERRL